MNNIIKNIKLKKYDLITLFLFIINIFFISNTIIKIEIISENSQIKKIISHELDKLNIKIISYKKTDYQINEIKEKILNNNKTTIEWLNIKKTGMKYIINIEERKDKNKLDKHNFCNIIATKEGTITKVITKSGTPIVDINEHVNKGDTLISGETKVNEEIKALICADGKVFAHTWYTISLKIPKTYIKTTKLDDYTKHIIIKYNNKTKKIGKSKYKEPITENKKILDILGLQVYISKEYNTSKNKEIHTEEELNKKIDELVKEKLKPFLINSNKLIKQNVLKKNDFNSTIDIELFIILEEEISFQNIELESSVS